jgi:hypothetical protein
VALKLLTTVVMCKNDTSPTRVLLAVFIVSGFLLTPWPAVADWLVTHDQATIETRGPWSVDGRRVVFSRMDGTLSSLRSSAVDLEASSRLSTAAFPASPEADPTTTRKAPVLILTDDDIAHQTSSAQAPIGESVVVLSDKLEPEGDMEVTALRHGPTLAGDGVEIFGVLRNGSAHRAIDLSLLAQLYVGHGKTLVGSSSALPESRELEPGESTRFHAVFPGVERYDQVDFEVQSLRVKNAWKTAKHGRFEALAVAPRGPAGPSGTVGY